MARHARRATWGPRRLSLWLALTVSSVAALLTVHATSESAGGMAPTPTPIPWMAAAAPMPSPALSTPVEKPAVPTPVPMPAVTPTVVYYVVQKGDNLTKIAAWYHYHGYGDVYALNKAEIGPDPNLILVGEKLVVQ